MATVSSLVRGSTVSTVRRLWTALCTRLDRGAPWLAVAVYGSIYLVLLFGAAIAAGYLGMVVPGTAGPVAFFISYLALVVAARRLVIRIINAT